MWHLLIFSYLRVRVFIWNNIVVLIQWGDYLLLLNGSLACNVWSFDILIIRLVILWLKTNLLKILIRGLITWMILINKMLLVLDWLQILLQWRRSTFKLHGWCINKLILVIWLSGCKLVLCLLINNWALISWHTVSTNVFPCLFVNLSIRLYYLRWDVWGICGRTFDIQRAPLITLAVVSLFDLLISFWEFWLITKKFKLRIIIYDFLDILSRWFWVNFMSLLLFLSIKLLIPYFILCFWRTKNWLRPKFVHDNISLRLLFAL